MGVESRPMTPDEMEQFHGGADKPGDKTTDARMFRRIAESPEERAASAARAAAREKDRAKQLEVARRSVEESGEGKRTGGPLPPDASRSPAAFGKNMEEFLANIDKAEDAARKRGEVTARIDQSSLDKSGFFSKLKNKIFG